MNSRATGTHYENMASDYLRQNGYTILHHNFRCRQGEIDLIAKDGSYLVFAEVKYRTTKHQGGAFAAVDFKKQQSISRTALFYFAKYKLPEDTPCRFDVIGIDGDQIQLIKNAFDFHL